MSKELRVSLARLEHLQLSAAEKAKLMAAMSERGCGAVFEGLLAQTALRVD